MLKRSTTEPLSTAVFETCLTPIVEQQIYPDIAALTVRAVNLHPLRRNSGFSRPDMVPFDLGAPWTSCMSYHEKTEGISMNHLCRCWLFHGLAVSITMD